MRLILMEKFSGHIQIGFRYSEHLGPRYEADGVSLYLSTQDRYEFTSVARWPDEDYSRVIEQGVRDGLSEAGSTPTWASACCSKR
ncbi:MAG: hypothetical protein ACRD9R_16770 [Pyrinomonadaceae bacterium]